MLIFAAFFDSVDHERLLRMLAHRITDPRIMRLVRMWLEAGILESGEISCDRPGHTAGGGDQSAPCQHLPALRAGSLGPISGVGGTHGGASSSCAMPTHFVMGFQSKADAERMLIESQGAATEVRACAK